jgi:site-specific DNA-cytosine methylase
MRKLKVLIACEESQAVTIAFRKLGHEAYSSDIQECSGGYPEWHIKGDVLDILDKGWDLIIAHPPCTHLAVSGARWFKEGVKPKYLQDEAADFFMKFINANCKYIAVENPVCIMSSRYKKPNQIINPFQFGHPEQKKTCLWLKNLPNLNETYNVYHYMMSLPIKERTRIHWLGSNKSKERSKTFQGIADAMANQWSKFILDQEN